MDVVPEEIVAPEAVQAATSSKAGPSKLAPPMKYWPVSPNTPSTPKKVMVPVTGKRSFAQATAPSPCPQLKPQSLVAELTLEAIMALACAFLNMMVDKILELWNMLTGASGLLAPHPATPTPSAATS
jgi:hypothetical protein